MIKNPFEDERRDACDDAKERDIQERLNQVLPLPPPVFTPHCPECLKPVIEGRNTQLGWHYCDSCGRQFTTDYHLLMRSLPPQPAPPYTQDEINDLADAYILAPVWWMLEVRKEATL